MLLQYKLPNLLSQHPVKLLVIDSLAALFRVELGEAAQAVQRASLLREFGHWLKMMSEKHSAAVVCVNQVSSNLWACPEILVAMATCLLVSIVSQVVVIFVVVHFVFPRGIDLLYKTKQI